MFSGMEYLETFQIKSCNHKTNIAKPKHFYLKLLPLKCHYAWY